VQILDNQIELDFSNLTGFENVNVDIDCNQELVVEMQSRHGGFQLVTPGREHQANNGFTAFVPYTAEFSVNALNSQKIRVESADMKGVTRGGSIGVIPYQSNGNLKLIWSSDTPMLGGRYIDVIEIRTSGKGR
ncbi:MAG: hypothetical protein HKN25_18330, partial [Pyrinomonadaceae bacterium]|nr:hypothetical protein [Pyrinomonadaceae bacterium]